jgi:hypothetical protein
MVSRNVYTAASFPAPECCSVCISSVGNLSCMITVIFVHMATTVDFICKPVFWNELQLEYNFSIDYPSRLLNKISCYLKNAFNLWMPCKLRIHPADLTFSSFQGVDVVIIGNTTSENTDVSNVGSRFVLSVDDRLPNKATNHYLYPVCSSACELVTCKVGEDTGSQQKLFFQNFLAIKQNIIIKF